MLTRATVNGPPTSKAAPIWASILSIAMGLGRRESDTPGRQEPGGFKGRTFTWPLRLEAWLEAYLVFIHTAGEITFCSGGVQPLGFFDKLRLFCIQTNSPRLERQHHGADPITRARPITDLKGYVVFPFMSSRVTAAGRQEGSDVTKEYGWQLLAIRY